MNFPIQEKEFFSNNSYAKYFFHYHASLWNCIVHIHLGFNNDITYHTSHSEKQTAYLLAKKYVTIRLSYLQNNTSLLNKNTYLKSLLPTVTKTPISHSPLNSISKNTTKTKDNNLKIPYSYIWNGYKRGYFNSPRGKFLYTNFNSNN